MNNKFPEYITELLKDYPSISSGRKNIRRHHNRILKTKKLIRKFILTNYQNIKFNKKIFLSKNLLHF